MFWRWNEEWSFMECERGEHVSQGEALTQRLFNLTIWGDYSGDILSRYHFDYLQRNAPDAVEVISSKHWKGLGIRRGGGAIPSGQLHLVIELIAYLESGDYPIFDDMDYSDFEYQLAQDEQMKGWWAEYTRSELVRALENNITDGWDNTLIPEIDTPEWGEVVSWMTGSDDDAYEYPYWETADSIIVPVAHDEIDTVRHLLEEYARSLNETQETELEINE